MKITPPSDVQASAREICAKIRQESESEASSLIEKARHSADGITREAEEQAAAQRQRLMKDAEARLKRSRENLVSTLTLAKKKLFLKGIGIVMEKAVAAVEAEAQAFRSHREYPTFLKKAIVEGAGVIDQEYIDVYYASLDERLITPELIKETNAYATHKHGRQFVFAFHAADFKDIGVILQSQDGHLIFDNRFAARLRRMRTEMGMGLFKEVL
jgi:vacuolar-type H+-ATPase subunit E/Vma4